MTRVREVVLAGYVRTPFGKADPTRGVFRNVRSDDLGVVVLREVLARTGLAAGALDGVILGAVEMLGEQAHPGTVVPFMAGYPEHVTGLSIERACTTAMMAIHVAAMNIMCNLGDAYVAGGLDSMTHFRIPVIRDGMDMDQVLKQAGTMLSTMNPNPRMAEMINMLDLNGGQGAERLCERFDISRAEMDRWAYESHRRAVHGQRAGIFAEEIVPTEGHDAAGAPVLVSDDQGPRADTSLEKIAALMPVYKPEGRITAATSSGQADGAAVCLLMSRERARAEGITPIATIRHIAAGACHPTDLIYSAIPATEKIIARSHLAIGDFDVVEVNEAFACAPIAFMRHFNADRPERMNVNGGACAIGHPVGASGARLVGTVALELRRRGGGIGLATICGGMGQGAATIVEVTP
jgi:acetyl-CoA acetyltransferase family protein